MSLPGDEVSPIEHLYFFVRVSTLQAICTISHSLRVEKIRRVICLNLRCEVLFRQGISDLGVRRRTPPVSLSSTQTMSWGDLSPEVHKTLDDSVQFLSSLQFESHSANILNVVLKFCDNHYAEIWPLKPTILTEKTCEALLSSQKGLKEDLHTAHKTGSYKNIRSRRECMSTRPVISLHSGLAQAEFHVKGVMVEKRYNIVSFPSAGCLKAYFELPHSSHHDMLGMTRARVRNSSPLVLLTTCLKSCITPIQSHFVGKQLRTLSRFW